MRNLKQFKRSIYAGICISLGGIIYLSVENKYLGAFLFSIGLYAVLVLCFDLYTGKVCSTDYLHRPLDLLQIWAGNAIGSAVTAFMMSGHTNLSEAAQNVSQAKICKPTPVVFTDALICGICIAIAVKGYQKADDAGKCLAIILGVMVFILCGAEHCVADMFYIILSGSFSIEALIFLLIVTAGNTIGGAIFSTIR